MYEVINKVCRKPSSGPDEMPGSLIKDIADIISIPLSNLINRSFLEGVYPEALKKTKVVPIFKNKGSTEDVFQYRPISVQIQLAKVFESCFQSRLYGYLEGHNLLSTCQHGFRRERSTMSAINSLISFITTSLNKKEHPMGIFFDMSRAFDMVDHNLLCSKLERMGVRGVANGWIRSFLSGREQMVQVNGKKSNYQRVQIGTPQGSVLSPILFCCFINDLPACCNAGGTTVIYADDTNFLISEGKLNATVSRSQMAIDQILE